MQVTSLFDSYGLATLPLQRNNLSFGLRYVLIRFYQRTLAIDFAKSNTSQVGSEFFGQPPRHMHYFLDNEIIALLSTGKSRVLHPRRANS